MKKLFFFAATAAIALSSCSSDDLAQAPVAGPEVNDGAVQFSAYSARNTRAEVTDMTQLQKALANGGGFGVFAYDQNAKDYATYSASNTQPNFMYNQPVTWNSGDNVWEYSPIKYYNNNTGAQHSFFAYAPYDASVKAVFSNSKAPQIRYTSNDDIDLLWGCEWDKTGAVPEPTKAPMNKLKPGVTDQIAFNFKHALSKVTITAVPFVDEVHGDTKNPTLHPEHTALGTLAEGTVVTLRSVKFEGSNMPSKGLLNLGDGTWTIEETDENAYDMATSLVWDASTGDLTLDDAQRKEVMTNKMIIPTQDKTFNIKVIYDVVTTDEENPKNNSSITNTITSSETFTLKAGVAYEFHLDLGLTSVKFNAKIVPWTINQDIDVDLPANALEEVTAFAIASKPDSKAEFKGESITAPDATEYTIDDLYYNTDDKFMYVCYDNSGVNDWKKSTTEEIFMENSVIYNVASTGATVRTEAPRFILVNSTDYHMLVNGSYGSALTKDLTTYASKTLGEFIIANPANGIYNIDGTIYYYKHQ